MEEYDEFVPCLDSGLGSFEYANLGSRSFTLGMMLWRMDELAQTGWITAE